MSFAAPWWLLTALAVPLLGGFWWTQRARRRQHALRHPGVAMIGAMVPRVPAWRRWLPAGLLALAALGLSATVARPQMTFDVPVEKASVVLVTDASGSMEAADVQPTRLQAAQLAAERFMSAIPDTLLVGVVGYASSVRATLDPTLEHEQVRATIAALDADGGTASGDALNAALDSLAARKGDDGETAPAAIVLLSDGKTTEGTSPLEAADRAEQLGIPIFTVALGTDDGVVMQPDGELLRVPPDPETLRAIADRSGGRAFQVEDTGALEGVYEDLGSRIGTEPEEREVSAAFAGVSLLLLAGGLGVGLRWRSRVV